MKYYAVFWRYEERQEPAGVLYIYDKSMHDAEMKALTTLPQFAHYYTIHRGRYKQEYLKQERRNRNMQYERMIKNNYRK